VWSTTGRRERLAEIGFELRLGPGLALLGDDVFEPRMLAVGAVAVLAVEADDGAHGGDEILGRDEGDRRRQARIGLRLVVGHAEAAAEIEVVAGEPLALERGEDAEIVGQHVDRVVLGNGEADLELPRQVGAPVERVLLRPGDALAVEPDLVIGAGRREEPAREFARVALEPLVHRVADRRGAGGDVAHDVAAGRERRQHRLVDRGEERLQRRLDYAVELHALARRDAQAAVAEPVGEAVQREPLRRGEAAAGDARAHHELGRLAEAALLPLGRAVAVVALIDAVELEERAVGVAEPRGAGVGDRLRERAAQARARFLDRLDPRPAHRGALGGTARKLRCFPCHAVWRRKELVIWAYPASKLTMP
jgi:hypothetical protein